MESHNKRSHWLRSVFRFMSWLPIATLVIYGVLLYRDINISSQIVFPMYHWSTMKMLRMYQQQNSMVPNLRRLEEKEETATNGAKLGREHHGQRHHMRDSFKGQEEVDGLRNDEVAVLITSTAKESGAFIRDRIIPSARTWMQDFMHVFVVIEDTFEVRFQMRQCEVKDYEHYTAFECLGEATYVMSRVCTNEYYGAAGPCCKVDDILNYLMNDRPDFFAHIKYVLHADDDMYFRGDQTMRWLASVENSGLTHLPLIGNGGDFDKGCDGVWHVKDGCKEICTVGWYQPLMLNRAALLKLQTPVAHYAVKDTCKGFDVTHDVGFGVLAWMIGAYHIKMPRVEGNGGHMGYKILNQDQMAIHYMKHHEKDHCRDGAGWPEEEKHNQDIVVGCGNLDHPGPKHDKDENWADMYDAYNYFKAHGKQLTLGKPGDNEWEEVDATVISVKAIKSEHSKEIAPDTRRVYPHYLFPNKAGIPTPSGSTGEESKEERLILPKLKQLAGYETTAHSKQHKISETWAPFSMTDCKIPGHV